MVIIHLILLVLLHPFESKLILFNLSFSQLSHQPPWHFRFLFVFFHFHILIPLELGRLTLYLCFFFILFELIPNFQSFLPSLFD
jgi:hypothetical protein